MCKMYSLAFSFVSSQQHLCEHGTEACNFTSYVQQLFISSLFAVLCQGSNGMEEMHPKENGSYEYL